MTPATKLLASHLQVHVHLIRKLSDFFFLNTCFLIKVFTVFECLLSPFGMDVLVTFWDTFKTA